MTRVQKESLCRHDMETGDQEEIRNRPHIVTWIQGDIPFCSLGTSSGKQKKAHSTSHPPFPSENTLATIETDQILSALQQLASNSNSNINNNSNKISTLLKSRLTTMPTFNGKPEKFELFEDLFQTSLKIHNQLTEEDKKNTSTLSCVVMHCRRSKTSAAGTERNWQQSWLCSVQNTWKPSQGYGKIYISTSSLQPSKTEANWFFGRTPEIGKRCIRSCCPSNHRPIHVCPDPCTPEEINKPGPLG